MKKRLLSAALALAMVLTLLPVSVLTASAAEPGVQLPAKAGVNVTRQMGDDPATEKVNGGWYWSETVPNVGTVWHKVTSGVISGTGTSGTWYSWDDNAETGIVSTNTATGAKTLKTTTFTLLQAANFSSLSLSTNPTTLVVDVNNFALTLPSDIDTLTTLTITNKYGLAASGSVSAVTKSTKYLATGTDAQKAVKGLTMDVTNATVTSISLETGLTNTINLHNGAIVTGDITLDGSNTDKDGNALAPTGQTLATDGSSVIKGAITITGNNSRLSLANVIGNSGATGTVTFNSTGGSVAVSGQSNIGAMTIKTNATTAVAASYPTINITGGTVAGIDTSTDTFTTSSPTVTVTGATIGGTDSIKVKAGTVNVNAGSNVTGTITVPTGALNITGGASGTKVAGAITLNGSGKTSFKVTGSNVETGNISASNGASLTVSIPNDLTNKFGTLTLTGYTGAGILGGNFKTAANNNDTAAYFASTLRFMAKDVVDTGYWSYYGEKDLAAAINALGGDAGTAGNIILVGHTAANNITLQNGTTVAKKALIGYSKLTSFYLPSVLLGDTITSWTNSASNVPYGPDALYTTPAVAANVTLVGQDTGIQLAATKLTSASVASSDAYTKGIRANLVGNVITLSGAVNTDSGYTAIPLTLETDVRDATGAYDTASVTVVYDSNKKTVSFDMSGYADLAAKSIVLSETSLSMNGGKTVYTLNGSGLGVPAAGLGTYTASTEIQVTVNKSGWTQYQKDALIAKMVNGTFTWNTVPAMMQAVNAAQLSISNETTLRNWITTAQNAVWRYGNTTGTTGFNGKGNADLNPHTTAAPTDAQRAAATTLTTKYAKVWLVPYLQVTVTDVNEATGYMTLTLTPYYRVDVSAETYAPGEYYTVQTGRTLGAITGDFATGVKVKFAGLAAPFTTAWMHQDGTYAYLGTAADGWTITHGSNNGLGSMVINTTAPLIELKNDEGASADPALWYDTLQAAVDDTKYVADDDKVDEIDINAGYTGTGVINVTGEARTFKITVAGNTNITASASGDLVKVTGAGHDYTVQLLKDTASATGDVEIAMATASNGYVSPNVSKAKTGDVITITAVPSTGYKVNTITAATNTGAAVTVSATGTLNQYTLTVPANTTKVTVTPTFVVGDNKATFSVNTNTTRGTASVYTGTSDGKVEQGKSATVTVIPTSGNRTMGLTAYGNNGATATVSRTGTNSFNVTVPSGATTVTVTPSFDIDNGTPFTDVLSNHWATNEISWAYRNGYTSGKDTAYTYKPADYITRGEVVAMLWKAANSPVVNYANPFRDVPTNYWAYNAVMWAASKGLIDTSTGYFNGTGYINRADTVVILYKQANSPTVYGTSGFADVASNASYSRAVTWARQQGLTNGYSGNTYFRPSYAISRAEVATFLYRAFG